MTGESAHSPEIQRESGLPSRAWMAALGAMLLTLICLWPVLNNGFVNWDDDAYVLRNPMVTEPAGEQIGLMFSTPEQIGLYHPLTMLSLSIDYDSYGPKAFGFHLTSLLLHLLNVLLVFLLIRRIGGGLIAAFIAALLFGIHPMHLESVAWISARKDVLYTAFYLGSLLVYLRYRKSEGTDQWLWYGLCLLMFIAALLSKAAAFTFPVVLFLMDYLERRKMDSGLWLEKLPFIGLALAAGLVAKLGQQSAEALTPLTEIPIHKTVFMGAHNAWEYLARSVVPYHLSPFQPLPYHGEVSIPGTYYLSLIPLAAGAFLIWRFFRRSRTVHFGLAFFLVGVAPLLMILPFGLAVFSERYTYLPYVGLFFLFGLVLEKVWNGKWNLSEGMRMGIMGLAAAGILALGTVTFLRAGIWKNGEMLWTDVIESYPDHYFGYLNRGRYLLGHEQEDRAIADFNRCISLNPEEADCHYERALWHERQHNLGAAIADYDAAIASQPRHFRALNNRGMARALLHKDLRGALADIDSAVAVNPFYGLAFLNRGVIYENLRDSANALENYEIAVFIEPKNAVFRRYRGVFHYFHHNPEQAEVDFSEAIALDPDYGNAWYLRSKIYRDRGAWDAAITDARKAGELGYELPAGYLQSLERRGVPPDSLP